LDSKRILIADDDKNMLFLIKETLRQYETDTVNNGSELLSALSKKDYDMIITDLMMPDMDGLECISKIREGNKDIPILCLTGAMVEGNKETYLEIAKNMGATDALGKPFSLDILLKKVKNLFA